MKTSTASARLDPCSRVGRESSVLRPHALHWWLGARGADLQQGVRWAKRRVRRPGGWLPHRRLFVNVRRTRAVNRDRS